VTQGPTQISNQLGAELRRVDADAFADDLKAGTKLLSGQYTIIGFLNSGGFGITYLAEDSLSRTVVIKECFPNALGRRSRSIVRARSRKHQGDLRSFVDSFVEEASMLSRLVHPNIVGVHRVFQDNDTAYMVIDYIKGRDLHDILDSTDQAFTPAETVEILKQLLGAVDYIHQVGILHRDISPDNILIDEAGHPILIDFGAASEQEARATRVLTGRRVIKEGYSPQEFYLTGAEQSQSSDLYSLGATFFHVITGKAPPESQRRLARVAEGSADPYEPLSGRYPGYPLGFLEAIDRAVQVLPKDRIQTAGDWLDWIRQGEAGEVPPGMMAPLPIRRKSSAVTHQPANLRRRAEDNLGFLIGAGSVFLLASIAGIWSLLN
jgi:serine/threonine protein kinase